MNLMIFIFVPGTCITFLNHELYCTMWGKIYAVFSLQSYVVESSWLHIACEPVVHPGIGRSGEEHMA